MAAAPPDAEAQALLALFTRAHEAVRLQVQTAIQRGTVGTERQRRRQSAAIAATLTRLRNQAAPLIEPATTRPYVATVNAVDFTAGLTIGDFTFAGVHLDAVKVAIAALAGRLDTAIVQVGREADDIFRRVQLEQAALALATADTRENSTRRMVADLRARGIACFRDRAGRQWSLDRYATMTIRTNTRELASTALHNRMIDQGSDLIEISKHRHDADLCDEFAGNTYSISGTDKRYPKLTRLPPYHPQCLHVAHPARTTFEDFEKALLQPVDLPPVTKVEPPAPPKPKRVTRRQASLNAIQDQIRALHQGPDTLVPGTGYVEGVNGVRPVTIIPDENGEVVVEGISGPRYGQTYTVDAATLEGPRQPHKFPREDEHAIRAIGAAIRAHQDRFKPKEASDYAKVAAEYEKTRVEYIRLERLRGAAFSASRDERAALRNKLMALRAQMDKLRQTGATGGAAELRKLLKQVRPGFGTAKIKTRTTDPGFQRLNEAAANFPKEWVQEAARGTRVQMSNEAGARGYYQHDYNRAGTGTVVIRDDPVNATHELGHRLQFRAHGAEPGGNPTGVDAALRRVDAAALAFQRRRTKGDPLKKMSTLFPTYAYEDYEVTREDKFVHAYVGKEYGNERRAFSENMMGDPLEVFTMGLEGVWHDKYDLRNADPEHWDLIVGMLAAV